MQFWIPSNNTDHLVQLTDPRDKRSWKVVKGKKSVNELLKENIEDTSRTDITDQQRTRLKQDYNV